MQIVVGETLLNYTILGNQNKESILILHGWGRSSKDWVDIGVEFSNDYKVILLDLPGFGGSSLPAKSIFDIYDFQKIVSEFINNLHLNKVTLIGHSFGGKIGIVLAAKSNILKKLILINSSGIETKQLNIVILNWLASNLKPLIKILPELVRDKIFSMISSRDYLESGEMKETFKRIVKQDVSNDARKVNCPTLLVWGENDKEVPISSTKILNRLIRKSVLRVVWNSGHDPHLTDSKKLLYLLREYL